MARIVIPAPFILRAKIDVSMFDNPNWTEDWREVTREELYSVERETCSALEIRPNGVDTYPRQFAYCLLSKGKLNNKWTIVGIDLATILQYDVTRTIQTPHRYFRRKTVKRYENIRRI